MPYLSRHGTIKPPLGAQIDPAHPFAQGLICAFLFQQDSNIIAADTARAITYALRGPAVSPDGAAGLAGARTPAYGSHTGTGAPAWASNRAGSALAFTSTDNYLTIRDSSGTTAGC